MLSEKADNQEVAYRDRLISVLVRARNPANIGAVARAMHDFGYAHLRVVNEFPVPFAAARSAVDASSVLGAAIEATNVAHAVHDCTFVFGTTAVGERVLEHPLHVLEDAARMIRTMLRRDPGAKIALLFGSEKTGLSNEELSHCDALLTIPMNTHTASRHLSMNLGQAVAVCLYAIAQSEEETPLAENAYGTNVQSGASAGDLERLTSLLMETLEKSGYTRRHPARARVAEVRRMVRRMNLSRSDAAVGAGMLRQMLYALPGSGDAPKRKQEGQRASRSEAHRQAEIDLEPDLVEPDM